jgi:hypothetical protein
LQILDAPTPARDNAAMPRPRRALFLSLAAVVVGLALGFWLLWPRPTGVTLENYQKIRHGMTRDEIEALLGEPPFKAETVYCDRPAPDTPCGMICRWKSNQMALQVHFDLEGEVLSCGGSPQWSWLETLLDRFGWE